jgi:NADPH-dependent 2,4-dienoyl-CoA reductase/sulfur reductase-like enzyme
MAAAAPAGAVHRVPGTTRNLWRQEAVVGRRPALEAADIEADVCIVGGGLAGLATAYRLATAGVWLCQNAGGWTHAGMMRRHHAA